MKVFFVRHGQADGDLVDNGRRQVEAASSFLKRLNMEVTQVCLLTSPTKRAVGSAEIIQQALGLSEAKVTDWLDDGYGGKDIPDKITEFFKNTPTCQFIVAVSHMPEIEEALERFARRFGKSFFTTAKNGSVYLVDTDTGLIEKVFQPS